MAKVTHIVKKIGRAQITTSPLPLSSDEDFYLREFRGKSLLFVLSMTDIVSPQSRKEIEDVLSVLASNGTWVVLIVETAGSKEQINALSDFQAKLCNVIGGTHKPMALGSDADSDSVCGEIWKSLRNVSTFIGLCSSRTTTSIFMVAQRLIKRLQVHKLVLISGDGPLEANGKKLSFLNGTNLKELMLNSCEGDIYSKNRRQLETVRCALDNGVSSVSLCSADSLVKELFTYEGCGTFFTSSDYCNVRKLALDDFREAEGLMRRGEDEGYLKKRTIEERGQLLLHGFGARLGEQRDLVGFCSLIPYISENAAEIAGLYAITRFHGEGVGRGLISNAIEEGRRRNFSYIFACTNQISARKLFERFKFALVSANLVPQAKWNLYESTRKRAMTVYKLDTR